MKTALLIIDMQEALCRGEEAGWEADRVLAACNQLAQAARAQGAPVVLVQHEETGEPLAFESPGWQLAEGLSVSEQDRRIRKSTPDAFHYSGLGELLKAEGIRRVVICGQQTDCCIDSSVRRALALGFDVVLAGDAHTTMDGVITAKQAIAHHNRVLGFMHSFGPSISVRPASDAASAFASEKA